MAWNSLIAVNEDGPLIEVARLRRPEVSPARSQEPHRRRPLVWRAVGAASVLGTLVLAVIIFIATNNGRIKIAIDGPARVVTIDGDTHRIEGLDEPITLRVGEHVLFIRRGDVEVETRKFIVHRGTNDDLRIEYEPKVGNPLANGERTAQPTAKNSIASASSEPIEVDDKDRQAARAALSHGGSLTIRVSDQERSIGSLDALPTAAFQLTHIRFVDQLELTDAGLEPFVGLQNLVEFNVRNAPKVTDVGVAHLRNLPRLTNLSLFGTSVSDAGLAATKGLGALEVLVLGNTNVSDDGLVHLRRLVKLKRLRLPYTRVTDAGLVHLGGLTELELLALPRTKVSDAGLIHLQNLTKLRVLVLDNTGVTNAGLVHLKSLTALVDLRLGDTGITDPGLVHLEGLTRLKELRMPRTGVTAAGLERLKKKLPACHVVAEPAALEDQPELTVAANTAARADAGRSKSAQPQSPSKVSTSLSERASDRATTALFRRLFNGNDKTGWTLRPGQPDHWRVENGVLIGRGAGDSHLCSVRGDYKDFHLRVEARVSRRGNSGIFFRAPFKGSWDTAYEAEIGTRTGSLIAYRRPVPQFTGPHLPAHMWFTLDVIADGNHLLTKIDGKVAAEYLDERPRFPVGHIILEQCDEGTVVEFRKVEIRELNVTGQETRIGDRNGLGSLFNGKDLNGWVADSGPKDSWRIENESLVVTGPGDYRESGFLLTDRDYSDFELRFDFQAAPGSNSGVAFWARPGERFGGIPHHPQIELFDADKGKIKNGSFIWSRNIGVDAILAPDTSPGLSARVRGIPWLSKCEVASSGLKSTAWQCFAQI